MDILLSDNTSLACAKDNYEWMSFELIVTLDDYDHKNGVIELLQKALEKEAMCDRDDSTISTHFRAIHTKERQGHGPFSFLVMIKAGIATICSNWSDHWIHMTCHQTTDRMMMMKYVGS